ncbi:hypothetical protein SAMN04487895_101538 [Paenibacillus sophorae]|uniref:Uncharacterized protein n=1 Tax=Paenibacillus sophorae TaxID=1333845 RepID=A0A1H8GIS8_9BACL|nr:hypothetical protein [Paenibacillus sophorae]QWU14246.1 hypothetical protein KP014_20260 [Paenibacillus sophorae]SEN44081.1 hypothetical protein SAMN04487895_101538 [Paenibacillus sophorae]
MHAEQNKIKWKGDNIIQYIGKYPDKVLDPPKRDAYDFLLENIKRRESGITVSYNLDDLAANPEIPEVVELFRNMEDHNRNLYNLEHKSKYYAFIKAKEKEFLIICL